MTIEIIGFSLRGDTESEGSRALASRFFIEIPLRHNIDDPASIAALTHIGFDFVGNMPCEIQESILSVGYQGEFIVGSDRNPCRRYIVPDLIRSRLLVDNRDRA